MVRARLATSYSEARRWFLDAADVASARTQSSVHPLTGLEGETLFVDVAEVGPANSRKVIVVVSGTHGVEGYLGSALQRDHLASLSAHVADDQAIVFVHALNPYGFSWMRRVNEDNVDLNRNFIDWAESPPRNDGYAELAEALVPQSWTPETQERTWTVLRSAMREMGADRSQQVVSGGQFHDPAGLFYGGAGPVWSHLWLRDFLRHRLNAVEQAVILDLHTGLGPWGHGELISSDAPGDDALDRARTWWGEVTSLRDGSGVGTEISGDWLGAAPTIVPHVELTGVAIEYGTVDSMSVLHSLRADAVLHAHGDPTGDDAAAVRQQVRDAFLDDDPGWLHNCAQRYRSVVDSAIEHLR